MLPRALFLGASGTYSAPIARDFMPGFTPSLTDDVNQISPTLLGGISNDNEIEINASQMSKA
jgi:hypothetical protein